jgi:hypothetical protein
MTFGRQLKLRAGQKKKLNGKGMISGTLRSKRLLDYWQATLV